MTPKERQETIEFLRDVVKTLKRAEINPGGLKKQIDRIEADILKLEGREATE